MSAGPEMTDTLERLSEVARCIFDASELRCIGASPNAAYVEYNSPHGHYRISLVRLEDTEEENERNDSYDESNLTDWEADGKT